MCQNTTIGDLEHGLKFITFYVQKHTAALRMCHNQPLVRDKPLGAPESVKVVYYQILKVLGYAIIDLRSAQVYCVAIFLVSQEVSLNFHRLCG